MCLSIFLFLSELGTCPQNLIPTRHVEHWEKNHYYKGYAEIHIQRPFFDNKIANENFSDWKSKRWKHTLVLLLPYKFLFLKNIKILIFGGISKFHLWIDFGSFWIVLGRFGQIVLHWQWLTTMPALPILLLKTSNIHNFWSIDPKNTIFFSRKAYCKMHLHKKF
jgi:hypothetical protein